MKTLHRLRSSYVTSIRPALMRYAIVITALLVAGIVYAIWGASGLWALTWIATVTLVTFFLVVCGLVYLALWLHERKRKTFAA